MLKSLIIFVACIQVYSFESISVINCSSGVNITTKCGYKINFSNIGNKSLHCILKFTLSNPTVKFSNYLIKVQRETAYKCPFFKLNIINIANGKPKDNKLSTTCGGTIEKMENKFSNFSSFVVWLDTKGLNDQDSKVNMSLVIDGHCNESWISDNFMWIIFIVVIPSGITLVIVFVIIYIYIPWKQKYGAVDRNRSEELSHRGSFDDLERGQGQVQQETLDEENYGHRGSFDDFEREQDQVQQVTLEEENYESIPESIGVCQDLIGSNK